MDHVPERLALVAEVRKWRGTPYHHHAAVLGSGIDCAHLILEAHVGAGLAERFSVEHYTHDWHLHRSEEKYLAQIEERLVRIDDCELPLGRREGEMYYQPGTVLVWRNGRTFSHGAIVTEWPRVVHASFPARSVVEESVWGGILSEKPARAYSVWGT